jgi:hypothetical protein
MRKFDITYLWTRVNASQSRRPSPCGNSGTPLSGGPSKSAGRAKRFSAVSTLLAITPRAPIHVLLSTASVKTLLPSENNLRVVGRSRMVTSATGEDDLQKRAARRLEIEELTEFIESLLRESRASSRIRTADRPQHCEHAARCIEYRRRHPCGLTSKRRRFSCENH